MGCDDDIHRTIVEHRYLTVSKQLRLQKLNTYLVCFVCWYRTDIEIQSVKIWNSLPNYVILLNH